MADYFFFGLAFLPTNDIEDCFVDLMADEPLNDKCSRFVDYILENYVTVNSKFPPTIWAAPPDADTKRMKTAATNSRIWKLC
jgi:hypothetical protein